MIISEPDKKQFLLYNNNLSIFHFCIASFHDGSQFRQAHIHSLEYLDTVPTQNQTNTSVMDTAIINL